MRLVEGARRPGPVLVEGGHYTLSPHGPGEPVAVPGVGPFVAGTTETTRWCFQMAAEEVARLRGEGVGAKLGLLVGDLAVEGQRPLGGAWALPQSYRTLLDETGLDPTDVMVVGEAYARNQGKRRLLDEARRRHSSAEASYASWGWALLRDGVNLLVASDASLEWDGDFRAAVLSKGHVPLCPLVFAGLKCAIFQAGYRRHVAIYAVADDAWIDVKLRAAAATVAQLRLGEVGEQAHRILRSSWSETVWTAEDLVGPGEFPWEQFLSAVRAWHPGAQPLSEPRSVDDPPPKPEVPCPSIPSRSAKKKPASPSSV